MYIVFLKGLLPGIIRLPAPWVMPIVSCIQEVLLCGIDLVPTVPWWWWCVALVQSETDLSPYTRMRIATRL